MGAISGNPLDLQCTVVRARQNVEQRFSGAKGTIGDAASLRVGGIDIIVASKRNQVRSPDVFTALGVDPLSKKIIVVKSAIAWQAHFRGFAADEIYVDTPGVCASNLKRFTYTQWDRAIYPIHRDGVWPPK